MLGGPNSAGSDEEPECEQWDVNAQLRGSGLMQQNAMIRTLCRDAIKIVETTIVTEHAWPELNRSAEYRLEVLLKACGRLILKDRSYQSIRRRIKQDEGFTKVVGKWVRLRHRSTWL